MPPDNLHKISYKTLVVGYRGSNIGDKLLMDLTLRPLFLVKYLTVLSKKFPEINSLSNYSFTIMNENNNNTLKTSGTSIENKSWFKYLSYYISNIIKCDLVIFLGGIFQDISSFRSFFFYIFLLYLSIVKNKKIVLLNSSIEISLSFNKKIFSLLFKKALKRNLPLFITLRDSYSYDIINNLCINLKFSHCYQVKDMLDNTDSDFRALINQELPYLKIPDITHKPEFFTLNIEKRIIQKSGKDLCATWKKNYEDNQQSIYNLFIFPNLSYIKNYHRVKKGLFDKPDLSLKIANILIFISDKKDINLIPSNLFLLNRSINLILLNEKSFEQVYKLLKEFCKREDGITKNIGYFERLHPFLFFSSYFKQIIVPENTKVSRYIDTWFK